MVDMEADIAFSLNGSGEPPPVPPKLPKLDDDDLALELRELWANSFSRFFGEWRVYEGGCWQQRDPSEVRRNVRVFLRQIRGRADIGRLTMNRVSSVTSLAGDDVYIPDRVINEKAAERARYINLENGLYNLETHRLEPHRADLYFIHQLPFAFDPDVRSVTFAHYLNTSLVTADGKPDKELIHLALEGIGYSLTARTDMKAAFWLVGKPDSGKSTMLSILRMLAGSLHTAVDLNELGSRFGLATIIGKRVATCTEANASAVIRDDVFKTLTGGTDAITIERKYRDPITIIPEAKLWWAMNDAPRTKDRSGAFFNRLHVIPFNRTIPTDKRDPYLEKKLQAELPGIFNIVMEFYRQFQKRGSFTTSQQSIAWKQAYEERNDTEASFLKECCKRDANETIKAQALFDAYTTYCSAGGLHPKSIRQVASDWERLGLEPIHRNDGTHWKGVRMK